MTTPTPAQLRVPGPADYRAGYIGGDLSEAEREPWLRILRALPAFDSGSTGQCRCGGTEYVIYRGRVYCPRCGRRPDSRSDLVAFVWLARVVRGAVHEWVGVASDGT